VNGTGESLPVTLTLESVSATTAIIKWSAAHDPLSASSTRLLVRRLDQFDGDSQGGVEDDSVRVVAFESTDSDGHYHLDELSDGQTYCAQLVVDQPTANLSNVLYFTTPEGLSVRRPHVFNAADQLRCSAYCQLICFGLEYRLSSCRLSASIIDNVVQYTASSCR